MFAEKIISVFNAVAVKLNQLACQHQWVKDGPDYRFCPKCGVTQKFNPVSNKWV